MRHLLVAWLFAQAFVSCASSNQCAVRAAEEEGFGDHALDCSDARAERTGKKCGEDYEVFLVTGCRLENGEAVNIQLAVATSGSCFARSPAGVCYE